MFFARWVLFAGALTAIGGLGAALVAHPAEERMKRAARYGAGLLVLGAVLVLAAQLVNWFGADGLTDPENLKTMLGLTLWGLHWTWVASMALSAVFLITIGVVWPKTFDIAAGLAALGIATFVPLVGHGGIHDDLAVFWHRTHLFGGGLWMGTLAVLTAAGIADPPSLLERLRRLAPVAFTGAALVALSGGALAWEHMQPRSTFLTTLYGRVLLGKLAAVLAVGALGFVNWRRPRLAAVLVELTIAFVVILALTAWISDLEPPSMAH